jgi:hypothetical protein
LGADLDGNNGAAFEVAEIAIYYLTLTNEEAKGMSDYFVSKSHQRFLQFNGTQWMRVGGA